MLDEADVMIATQGHQVYTLFYPLWNFKNRACGTSAGIIIMKFFIQDQSIRIHKQLSSDCQVMLFSATYDSDVMDFAENIVPNPVVSFYKVNQRLIYVKR